MASSSSGKYDVFLNFRGSDMRVNIIPVLLNGLWKAGVNVFVDQELERGEEISPALFAALEGSRISIIIFSPDYASSVWCLNELAKIMEYQETKGQLVLPIFCEVDPSDVREQRGIWGAAFARHEAKYESEKVQTWRSALCKAANFAGWYLDYKSGENFEIIELIVDAVFKKLNSKPVYTKWDNEEPAFPKLDSESVAAKSNSERYGAEFQIQQFSDVIIGLVSSILNGSMPGNVQSSSIHQLIAAYSEKHVESVEERKKNLNRKLQEVVCMEEDVISELEILQIDPANQPKKGVANWLDNVVETKNEARSMLQELDESKSKPLLGNRADNVIKRLSDLLKLQRPYVIHNPPVIQTNQKNNTNVGMVGGAPSP